MNRNLYSKELKRNRKSQITWTAIIGGFTILVMTFFPSMQEMGDSMDAMMEGFPDSMKKAFGMTEGTWTNVLGFYSTYYSLHIMVLTGIFAMSSGSNLLAKEEREHTAEFLYTRPLKRKSIYISKGASLITIVLITIAIQTALGALGVVAFSEGSDYSWGDFMKMHVNGAGLVIFFTCLGYFLPTVLKPKVNYMGIAVGAVFGGYIVNALSLTSSSTEWVGYMSPFHYVDFSVMEAGYDYSWAGIAGLIGIGITLVVLGSIFFQKRDINA